MKDKPVTTNNASSLGSVGEAQGQAAANPSRKTQVHAQKAKLIRAEKLLKKKGTGRPFQCPRVVRYDKNRIDKNLVAVLKPYSFETEMFKVLRGKIMHPLSGAPPRAILVTSAVPGEGKSFVASNLAITMAQYINEHVLLVDCDTRRPCLHQRFGFPDVPGLSEHLAKGTDLGQLLLKTMLKKLRLLPAGRHPHNPSEILSSPRMRELLRELITRYEDRYIVLDTPPPQLAPETLAISKEVDGILIVVRHKSTPQDLVLELAASFEREKILGVVLNRFDLRSSKSYGYGRYKQYKKYYRYNR